MLQYQKVYAVYNEVEKVVKDRYSAKVTEKRAGQYYLLEKIAQGGMAEIYKGLAYDTTGIQKPVCIKKILPQISASREFIDMLVDEAKIAVQLNHGNIAQIFDLGKASDDYFIVMEFVDGQTLSKLFKRTLRLGKIFPIDLAVYIMAEVAGGLNYMHRKADEEGRPLNIIHRDISPQNIMVSYSGTVKIIDFGIAKAAVKIGNTDSGTLKGKFAYMSPEQARGDTLDNRSDIFSLGVIFYELLTGTRLFKGKNNDETLKNVKRAQVNSPSEINSEIPKILNDIVMKTLGKDRRHRFSFAAELQEDLLKFLHTHFPNFTPVQAATYVQQLFAKDIDLGKKREEVAATTPHLILDRTQTRIVPESSEEQTEAGAGGIDWRPFMLESEWPEETSASEKSEKEEESESAEDSLEEETHFPKPEMPVWKKSLSIFGFLVLLFGIALGGIKGFEVWKSRKIAVVATEIIKNQKPPEALKIPVASGSLVVTSTPEGAEIYWNDEATGFMTPHTFKKVASGTKYRLGLFLKNYRFYKTELETKPGETQHFSAQLPVDYGSLSIDSIPKGAKIFIDGQNVGRTPLTLELLNPETIMNIELQADDFLPFTREVKILAGKKETLNAQMVRR